MSLESPARSTRGTALSASVGAVVTLGAFVAVFAVFVLAPLLLLAAALLAYVAVRPRETAVLAEDLTGTAGATGTTRTARHHFGSGAR